MSKGPDQNTLSINQVAAGIKNGSIVKLSVDGDTLTITNKDGS